MRAFNYALMLLVLAVGISCTDQPQSDNEPATSLNADSTSPIAYDFANPVIVTLKKKLKEISGIVYIGENQLAAIEDETGVIFIVNYENGEIVESFGFAGKGDFEDVAIDNRYYYVLESDGIIFRVPRATKDTVTTFKLPGKKKREFESLFIDAGQKNLVLLCKECKHEDDIKEGFCFNLNALEFSKDGCLSIDLRSIERSLPAGTLLKPSAAAINPADKKLYVLCSVGKSLLQCTQDGKIEQAVPLDPKIFRQPEGIAFTPNGDMIISNEAAGEQATLVKIKKSTGPNP